VHGLRIRQRMREQYGTATTSELASSRNDDEGGDQDEGDGGGFLTGAGDVVQPYSLPRPTHVVFASPPRSPEPDDLTPIPAPEQALALSLDEAEAECDDAGEGKNTGPKDSDWDVRSDHRPADKLASPGQGNGENRGMPKSMAELAAEAEAAATARMSKAGQGQEDLDLDAAMGEVQEGAASPAPRRRHAPPRARPKANGEARTEYPRGRKRVRAREREDEDEDEDEWADSGQPGDSGVEGDAVGKDGRTRDAKRARTRAGLRDRGTALAVSVPVPTSDRVLRARKK